MTITKGEIQTMIGDIQANAARLKSCPRHRFDGPIPAQRPFLRQRLRCAHCGGEMRILADLIPYMRGFQASGGDPAEIWPAGVECL